MRKLTFFSLLAVLFLAACNEEAGATKPEEAAGDEPAVEEDREKAEKEEKEVAEDNEKQDEDTEWYPLTGKASTEHTDQRVVSVMVNNHTKARPQSGLSQADIVYEILAEGQITRFLALFHSHIPDKIGPVRSARPYFFQIADGYDALYTYHGASASINQKVANSGVDYLDGSVYDNNGWLFQRSSDRLSPHNSYLLTDGIKRAAESQGYQASAEVEGLPFSEKDDFVGIPIDEVQIAYGSRTQVNFTYDPEDKQFLRSSDGEPTVDQLNGERVSVENVWIIETDHRVIDNAGRRDIDLTSGGNGYLLQKGQMKEVKWKNVDGRLLPFENGRPLAFTPGQTWVNIIPENAAIQTD
ncbi:Protein of unknown function [Halobacillus karajensis]|uniref:Lipoprotein YerB n=1 Tax=Halobacillus karajensis TaxID=195088 RepID=A0A024P5I3_9BACI|nr:DUF3048 domain-containing protein [Halobacillus karajensis]CDQ20614.1 Putative lipoprotein YerB precursor [Halobacillus karajensis]CDQ23916.1 Putative lipoprotein YerB precursor [Halobacillus karajensis]CDQ27394.1 Putative lipoprotein YerB precursor [Halobacillus karajensis]SEH88725.1 Protein of unknown function [Halobacillus karajensis]